MSIRGVVVTPPDLAPARCYPSDPSVFCLSCTRHCSGEHPGRDVVTIDYSAIADSRDCALFLPEQVLQVAA